NHFRVSYRECTENLHQEGPSRLQLVRVLPTRCKLPICLLSQQPDLKRHRVHRLHRPRRLPVPELLQERVGGLLEGGVGVGEAAEGVGVDGAEERGEEVGEVRVAVGGEAREVREGGERVGERGGGLRGGDGEEGGERGAVRRGDGVRHAGEVVGDAAVRLSHAQVRRHLRRG
ncbi:Os09g0386450, partial [Oryza sativa Japonica Group]